MNLYARAALLLFAFLACYGSVWVGSVLAPIGGTAGFNGLTLVVGLAEVVVVVVYFVDVFTKREQYGEYGSTVVALTSCVLAGFFFGYEARPFAAYGASPLAWCTTKWALTLAPAACVLLFEAKLLVDEWYLPAKGHPGRDWHHYPS